MPYIYLNSDFTLLLYLVHIFPSYSNFPLCYLIITLKYLLYLKNRSILGYLKECM